MIVVVVTVPCHRWRRWRPCDAIAVCSLGAVLGSRYSSTMHTNYPDTLVSDALLLSSPLSFQSPQNLQDHAFSRHPPGKQAAVDGFFSSVYAVRLPLLVLRCYLSPQYMIYLASSARTKLPLPSVCPSSLLKLSPSFTSTQQNRPDITL